MDTSLIPEQLKNKIESSMAHPYVWPEIEQLQSSEQLLAQKYLYGKLKKANFSRKLSEIQSEVPSLIVKSVPELEFVMHYLKVDEEVLAKTLQDMSFQYERAINKGYPCRFSIWFYRTLNNGIAMYCATQINI